MLPMAGTAVQLPPRAINAKIVDLAGTVTKKMLVIQNIKMTFTWKHPKHYKRIPREKAISPEESTDSEGRTPKASSSKKELNEKRVETELDSREDR